MPPPAAEHRAHIVAVVDKHEAIHVALQSWCEQARPPIRFAGGYASAEHFLTEHPSCPASPVGIVVCDLQTHSGPALFTGVDRLVDAGYRVIVYTHAESDDVLIAGLEHGAIACLAKSDGNEHLIKAIRAADSHTPYIGPRLARAMPDGMKSRRPKLALREKEVLVAWFRTDSKDEAARQLSIAPTTVSTTLQRIRAKYAAVGRPATTKAALVVRAIQDGIIGLEEL
jgi:DNA-binding NarL/FixJ family response regulator